MNYEDRDRNEHGEVLQRSDPGASHSADGDHNRTPNAVDHYSLVLQIIQVVPVITAFIVHAIADDLLANLLSWLLLLIGTGSVVWIERIKRHRDRRPPQPRSQPQAEPPTPGAPPPVPIVTTSTTEAGITISIWVGQPVHDRTATERRRARRSAKARQRARNRSPDRA